MEYSWKWPLKSLLTSGWLMPLAKAGSGRTAKAH